jgi:hypothetical protein
VLLQVIFEVLAEIGFHSLKEPFRGSRPGHPLMAALGYALLGAIAGAVSLAVVPQALVTGPKLRIANLILSPVAAGLVMSLLRGVRLRRGQTPVRLDSFAYGYIFALAMALVRFNWAGV